MASVFSARTATALRYAPAIAILGLLVGCGSDSSGSDSAGDATVSAPSDGGVTPVSGSTSTTSSPGATGATTKTPSVSIHGTPSTKVAVGNAYAFRPSTTVAAGRTVGFLIENKPDWATFSTATGQLTGTPAAADAGVYANIVISASDGNGDAVLNPFAITVQSTTKSGKGTATLSWSAPISNTNGTNLTDLAGFRIYYGTSSAALNNMVDIVADGNTDGFVVSGLPSGTYYFAVSAYDSAGVESAQSGTVSRVIS